MFLFQKRYWSRAVLKSNIVLSLLGQQQQFHFAFGQRPFPFAASDPLSGFRMPPIGNCNSKYSFILWVVSSYAGKMKDLNIPTYIRYKTAAINYFISILHVLNNLQFPDICQKIEIYDNHVNAQLLNYHYSITDPLK